MILESLLGYKYFLRPLNIQGEVKHEDHFQYGYIVQPQDLADS